MAVLVAVAKMARQESALRAGMRIYSLVASLFLAGCSTAISALDGAPAKSWVSNTALDPTAACVVEKMRAGYSDGGWAFAADVVAPNNVYEVRPRAVVMVGGDPLVVRLTKVGFAQTKIELFGLGIFGREPVQYLEACIA